MSKSIVIIGGGIVGLASAYRLLQTEPSLRVVVLEKENAVGTHQTGHNSGVIHSGLYYAPESQKAELTLRGRKALIDFCLEFGVKFQVCGKLVAASDSAEIPRLESLHRRGIANGLSGLKRISAEQAREVEPHLRCAAALVVPQTGVVDFAAVAHALCQAISARGGQIIVDAAVTTARYKGNWEVRTANQEFSADYLIGCAGLEADRVARLAGVRTEVRIVPFRGDYFTLEGSAADLVRGLIYPVPNPIFPFLGVHATRGLEGQVHLGPSAALALSRRSYSRYAITPSDAWLTINFIGVWRFIRNHRGLIREGLQLTTKRGFLRAAQRLIPEFQIEDLQSRHCGIRAQAMLSTGNLVDDFLFEEGVASFHVMNAPSPAATSSLAIGQVIADKVLRRLSA